MKNFTKCLMLVVALAVFSTTFAQTTVSGWVRNTFIQNSSENPDICVTFAHQFEKSKWSAAGFTDVCKAWGESYLGPRYAFADWLFASAYAGVEVANGYWRAAIDVNVTYKAMNLYNVYEYGASGKTGDYGFSDLTYAVNNSLKAELKAYKLGSVGKVGGGGIYTIAKSPIAISPIILYNFDSKELEAEAMMYFNF